MHPLQGIHILDLTRLLPGAVCSQMLVDLGGDVIKVEDPNGGDYARWLPPMLGEHSAMFSMNNRSKRSIIINLKTAEGQAIFKRLVERADVLIEGNRPGVMARLGLDYDSLHAVNPALVYCALSGWGVDGPYAQASGHDLNYASRAGLVGSMQTPQVIGGQIADIGGAYAAVSAILAALLRRERGGGGAFLDISLAEAALPFVLYNWTESVFNGTQGGQGGLSGGAAFYRVYMARDGLPVALGAIEEKFWSNFCTVVGRTDLIENYFDPARQRYLAAELTEIFATRTATEWDTLLSTADCCFTLVLPPGEVADDPQFKARRMLGRFDDEHGTPWMRSPLRISGSTPEITNAIPGYGQHTREILADAGYSADEIAAFIAQGTVKA